MARWTDLLIATALMAGAAAQASALDARGSPSALPPTSSSPSTASPRRAAGFAAVAGRFAPPAGTAGQAAPPAGITGHPAPPGELFEAEDAQRAVLLEFAEFHAEPSSDGPIVSRLAAGTALDYVGETTDAFGRTWFTVRDPARMVRRRDTYLVPYDYRQFVAYGYRAALLADRLPAQPAMAVAPGLEAPQAAGEVRPWWKPVGVLELGHDATFDGIVGISARAPAEAEAREAVALLGGMRAIAEWPVDALPGQLLVPPMLPLLFEFDGAEWRIAQPVRLLGDALNLLGNGSLGVNAEAPPLAGGPALYCWQLVGALDPRDEPAGSVAPAPPVATRGQGPAPPPDIGPYDLSLAPQDILALLPPGPPQTRVPTRVDPPAVAAGVLLSDDDGRQAVYLRQRLGSELTHRLRGMSLVLDVVARDSPRSQAAATFGLDVEVGFGDDRPPQNFATSYTSRTTPRRYELAFEVPAEAETLTVRLLPLDRTLAVEQRGSVVFERAALRPATWSPEPPASSVILYRINVHTFEGAPLHTRAAVAVTGRSAEEIQRTWPQVAISSWSEEDKSLVLAGDVRHGMTPEQVRASWGDPAQETASGEGAASEVRWDYEDRFAVFAGGELVVFRPRREIETRQAPKICPGGPPLATGGQRP